MNPATLLFAGAAIGTLWLGFQVFRLTCSKGVRLATCLGAASLGYAASEISKPGGAHNAACIAFVVAMLFLGRAFGVYWQSRRNAELRAPSNMLFAIAALSVVAAVTALLS